MRYTKPALSIDDQINLLESRKLIIPDKDKAAFYLSNISYYRLSAYMYPFKVIATDNFVDNVSFDDILNLYLFDREFRLLVFDAIERIEIAFRTQMIYHPSMSSGAWWFEDSVNFDNASLLTQHLIQLDSEIERTSEVFLEHFRAKYDEEDTPPAWMTFEVLTIGLLSKFYQNIRVSLKAKKDISNHFGVSQPIVFQSWIRSITYVRNICAHHSRLWNRILTNKPIIPRSRLPKLWISDSTPNNDKVYYFLCCLLYLLRQVNPDSSFVKRLKGLFAKYNKVPKSAMGFPDNWENDKFWQ